MARKKKTNLFIKFIEQRNDKGEWLDKKEAQVLFKHMVLSFNMSGIVQNFIDFIETNTNQHTYKELARKLTEWKDSDSFV